MTHLATRPFLLYVLPMLLVLDILGHLLTASDKLKRVTFDEMHVVGEPRMRRQAPTSIVSKDVASGNSNLLLKSVNDRENNRSLEHFTVDAFFRQTLAIPMMTTLLHTQSDVSIERARLVNEQLARFRLRARFALGINATDSRTILPHVLQETLQVCANSSDVKYCLLFQDDTVLHHNFREEIWETVQSLPLNWMIVHMCPGKLRMRQMARKVATSDKSLRQIISDTDASAVNNSLSLEHLSHITTPGGKRYFLEHVPKVKGERIFFGRPVAFILRQERARELLQFCQKHAKAHDDVLLSKVDPSILADTYVAREPQLCYHLPGPSDLSNGMISDTFFA
eukprot:m.209355 g.209355  ORF g.209355 m.209355 type:complete len:339 (+) comp18978_c0_seq2:585-1601(+)